ncbi:hypothetical protein QOT17_008563 [Balamuthia mandrillaris]
MKYFENAREKEKEMLRHGKASFICSLPPVVTTPRLFSSSPSTITAVSSHFAPLSLWGNLAHNKPADASTMSMRQYTSYHKPRSSKVRKRVEANRNRRRELQDERTRLKGLERQRRRFEFLVRERVKAEKKGFPGVDFSPREKEIVGPWKIPGLFYPKPRSRQDPNAISDLSLHLQDDGSKPQQQ